MNTVAFFTADGKEVFRFRMHSVPHNGEAIASTSTVYFVIRRIKSSSLRHECTAMLVSK